MGRTDSLLRPPPLARRQRLPLSDFPEAALLTVDGVGEWATTSYGRGRGAEVELFEEVDFPHSLGLLYATLTSYLGFEVNDGEYKVMGLAPYGEPRYLDEMRRLVSPGPGGQYRLDLDYFDFVRGRRMYSDALPRLFGEPPRRPEAEITRFHQDVARSLQAALEEILLAKAAWLHEKTGLPDLCMAGGVALNVVAERPHPARGAVRAPVRPARRRRPGGCLGAAALAYAELTGKRPEPLCHVYRTPLERGRGRRPPRRHRDSRPRLPRPGDGPAGGGGGTVWSGGRWWAGSTARSNAAPGRSAGVACWRIRATPECATG